MARPLNGPDASIERSRQLLGFNQASTAVLLALAATSYVGLVRSVWLLVGGAWLIVFFAWITVARCRLGSDTIAEISTGVLIGNWITALAITTAAPFTYPAAVLHVIIPVIAGAPVLGRRALLQTVAGSTAMTAIVVAVGLAFNDIGINDAVSEPTQAVTLMIGLPLLTIAVGSGVWDAHQRQQLALRNERDNNQLIRESRQRLVAAADNERIRIERDLHDGAQQGFVAVAMHLRQLRSSANIADKIDPIVEDLDEALASLRQLAHGIYPPLLRSHGLGRAISAAAARSPIPVSVDVTEDRFNPEIEACLYFCCLEAMQNTAKHGGPAPTVHVQIAHQGSVLVASVTDDGPGIAAGETWGSGLTNIHDRVGALGGQCSIDTTATGTTVHIEIPSSAA